MKTPDLIYKILETLDEKLDDNNPDFSGIKHESLGVTRERWAYTLEMMQESGLIKGVSFTRTGKDRAPTIVLIEKMQITLRGINYLAENSTTSKIINAAKLLKDVIPGI